MTIIGPMRKVTAKVADKALEVAKEAVPETTKIGSKETLAVLEAMSLGAKTAVKQQAIFIRKGVNKLGEPFELAYGKDGLLESIIRKADGTVVAKKYSTQISADGKFKKGVVEIFENGAPTRKLVTGHHLKDDAQTWGRPYEYKRTYGVFYDTSSGKDEPIRLLNGLKLGENTAASSKAAYANVIELDPARNNLITEREYTSGYYVTNGSKLQGRNPKYDWGETNLGKKSFDGYAQRIEEAINRNLTNPES